MPIAMLSGARQKKILAALEGNWQAEMEGYHTYNALADRDTEPVRAQVLRHLAPAETGACDAVGRAHQGFGRARAGIQGQPRRRGRFAGQPCRRHPHGAAPAGD